MEAPENTACIWQEDPLLSIPSALIANSIKIYPGQPGVVVHAYNPRTVGGQGRGSVEVRSSRHPGQDGETLLLKMQKSAEHGGRHLLSQLLGRLRQENRLNPGGGGGGGSELRLQ